MVTKKKEDSKKKLNVSIRYRDGGVDKYHGIESARVNGNVLEIIDDNGVLVGIVLNVISYYNIEEGR